jgi:hypothetical protein
MPLSKFMELWKRNQESNQNTAKSHNFCSSGKLKPYTGGKLQIYIQRVLGFGFRVQGLGSGFWVLVQSDTNSASASA